MALFDFLRHRKPKEERPRQSRIGAFFSRIFNRRRPDPGPQPVPAPEPEPELLPEDDLYYDEPLQPAEPDIIIDDYYVESQIEPAPPVISQQEEIQLDQYAAEHTEINPYTDTELLDKYGKMIDTMVNKGYIVPFENDADAAEFLRVLSSKAWEEAYGYWYSIEALSQIQDAITRGAMAGTLQSNYNAQIEKKSNNYLKTWEDWLQAGY